MTKLTDNNAPDYPSLVTDLQERLSVAREKRLDDLRIQGDLNEAAMRRMEHVLTRKLRIAEKERVDAILLAEKQRVDANRAADAAAIQLTNLRAEVTAAALAERVDTSAKTLALQVEATKTAAALAVDSTTLALGSRIKPLEDARYESSGRAGGIGSISKIIYAVVGAAIPVILYLLSQTRVVPTP